MFSRDMVRMRNIVRMSDISPKSENFKEETLKKKLSFQRI